MAVRDRLEGLWPVRRRGKIDGNHTAIVAALRQVGASVVSLANLGKGVPDLLVGKSGRTWLVEVKQPGGKLTEDQQAFASSWRGSPVWVVRSVEDALVLVAGGRFDGSLVS